MTEPKVVITITATDALGSVEARREIPATRSDLREAVAKAASETATHASDLMDAHIASLKAARR